MGTRSENPSVATCRSLQYRYDKSAGQGRETSPKTFTGYTVGINFREVDHLFCYVRKFATTTLCPGEFLVGVLFPASELARSSEPGRGASVNFERGDTDCNNTAD
jgi:hypothetical protein